MNRIDCLFMFFFIQLLPPPPIHLNFYNIHFFPNNTRFVYHLLILNKLETLNAS